MDEPPDQPAAAVHRATRRPLEPASSHSPTLAPPVPRERCAPGSWRRSTRRRRRRRRDRPFDRSRRPDARWVGRHHVERTRLDDVEVLALGAVSAEGFTGGHDTRFHVLDRRGQHPRSAPSNVGCDPTAATRRRAGRARPARVGAQGSRRRTGRLASRAAEPFSRSRRRRRLSSSLAPRVPARTDAATAPRDSRSQRPGVSSPAVRRTRVFSPG